MFPKVIRILLLSKYDILFPFVFFQAIDRKVLRAEIAASLLLSNSNTVRTKFIEDLKEFNGKRKAECEKVIEYDKEYKAKKAEEKKEKEELEKKQKREEKTAKDVANQTDQTNL